MPGGWYIISARMLCTDANWVCKYGIDYWSCKYYGYVIFDTRRCTRMIIIIYIVLGKVHHRSIWWSSIVGSIIVVIYNNTRLSWFGPRKGQKSELTYETRCSFDEPGKPLRFGSAPTCQTKSRKKRKLMDISSSGRIVIRKTVAP